MTTNPPETAPEPLGYYVLVRQHDRWVADWDGELHPTREAGEKSCAEARADGWEAVLTAAVPFPIDTEGGA